MSRAGRALVGAVLGLPASAAVGLANGSLLDWDWPNHYLVGNIAYVLGFALPFMILGGLVGAAVHRRRT